MNGLTPVATKRLLLATAIASVIVLGGCSTASSVHHVRPLKQSVGLSQSGDHGSSYEKGKAYFHAGKYGLALQEFETELVKHPHSIVALNGIGATYDKLGRYDLAVSYYYRALQLNPDSVQTLGNLGYSFLLQGRPEAARGVLELAAAIQPDNAVVARNLAMTTEQMSAAGGYGKQATAKGRASSMASAALAEAPASEHANKPADAEQRQTPVMQMEVRAAAPSAPPTTRHSAAVRPAERAAVQTAEPGTAASMAATMSGRAVARPPEQSSPVGALAHGTRDDSGSDESVAQAGSQSVEASTRIETSQVVADVQLQPATDPAASDQGAPEVAVIYHELPTAVGTVRERTGETVLAFDTLAGTVEISNGNGYEGMAGLLSRYYTDLGQQIAHVTNAEHFNHARTVIFYRAGKRGVAEALLQRLPVRAGLQESASIRTDAQLVLGKDLSFYQGAIERLSGRHGNPQRAFAALNARIEVSNGNGRRGMARLMARVLGQQGDKVSHVTNADSFLYPKTRIFYAPGEAGEARALASRLPVDVELIAAPHGVLRRDVDVRVVIGHDFLRYEHAMNGLLASQLKAGAGV